MTERKCKIAFRHERDFGRCEAMTIDKLRSGGLGTGPGTIWWAEASRCEAMTLDKLRSGGLGTGPWTICWAEASSAAVSESLQ